VSTLAAVLVRKAMLSAVLPTMSSWSLCIVTICNEEGVPGRGTEHPRAFALAPGGDSGAQPTAVAISSGGRKWPLQTDVGTIILRV
jgi:hypothetical protein